MCAGSLLLSTIESTEGVFSATRTAVVRFTQSPRKSGKCQDLGGSASTCWPCFLSLATVGRGVAMLWALWRGALRWRCENVTPRIGESQEK